MERLDPKPGGQSKGRLAFTAAGCGVRSEASKGPACFVVACGGEEELLRAGSPDERDAWVADIKSRMEKYATRKNGE